MFFGVPSTAERAFFGSPFRRSGSPPFAAGSSQRWEGSFRCSEFLSLSPTPGRKDAEEAKAAEEA